MSVKSNRETVVIQGLGFVGAITSILVARSLNLDKNPLYQVFGLDIDTEEGRKKTKLLQDGRFPIACSDPNVTDELQTALQQENLSFTNSPEVLEGAHIVISAIPLSYNFETKEVLWNPYLAGMRTIAERISAETLVILESTVPPGTTELVVQPIFESVFNARKILYSEIQLAHSYERVMPGPQYWESARTQPRIFAAATPLAKTRCRQFLASLLKDGEKGIRELESPRASETAKVLENSYRAVNIAFIDEWSEFSEGIGVDLFSIIDVIKERPTHKNIMLPGFGVGGYCLTKDPLFADAAQRDIFSDCGWAPSKFPFSRLAVQVNQNMPLRTVNYLKTLLKGSFADKKIALWGISYRSEVADTRFTPAEPFTSHIEAEGGHVSFFDPFLDQWEETQRPVSRTLMPNQYFDAIVVAVPHRAIKEFSFSDLTKQLVPLIFDAGGILSPSQIESIQQRGIKFFAIGRDLRVCHTH